MRKLKVGASSFQSAVDGDANVGGRGQHHEKKLLKKVDFLQWKQDATLREAKVMRTYHIQRRHVLLPPLPLPFNP